jgi:hypothetical protein
LGKRRHESDRHKLVARDPFRHLLHWHLLQRELTSDIALLAFGTPCQLQLLTVQQRRWIIPTTDPTNVSELTAPKLTVARLDYIQRLMPRISLDNDRN